MRADERSRIVRAYIGLGANLGDASGRLADAATPVSPCRVPAFEQCRVSMRPRRGTPTSRSSERCCRPRRQAPLGPRRGRCARSAGRPEADRTRRRPPGPRPLGPREIDLDLVYGRQRIDVDRPADARSIDADLDQAKATKRLEVPHRHLRERLFVLAPLADVAPRLVPPGWTETIETRRRAVTAASAAVNVVGDWDARAARWSPAGRPSAGRVRPSGLARRPPGRRPRTSSTARGRAG